MANLYRIKNWEAIYENNRTRDLRTMRWLPLPMTLDGDGYTLLMERKDGAALYGAFIACLILAGRCDPRGTLVRKVGPPHDAVSISRITRCPVDTVRKMLEMCVDTLQWIEIVDVRDCPQEGAALEPQEGATIPQEGDAFLHNNTEHNNTEQESAPSSEFAACAEHLKRRILERRQQKITNATILEWANDARLMIERDGRTVEQIDALIDECHNMEPTPTGFTWRNNILSMGKLRERWNEGKIYVGMSERNRAARVQYGRQEVTPEMLAAQAREFLGGTDS